MKIDLGLILTKVGEQDVLVATKQIDPSALVFVYVNGVPTFTVDSDKISGNLVDVTGLDITINDDLTLMYDEL